MKIVMKGKADLNKTVDQLMGEVARTGNRYLDLSTGSYVAIASDVAPAPEPKKHTEEELAKLSMKELRKIGDPLGAYDTKKSELIQEILVRQ